MSDSQGYGPSPDAGEALSAVINFRTDPAMARALQLEAQRRGASVSDVIRSALRGAIQPDALTYNPFAMIRPAATGDLAAQRAYVAEAIAHVTQHGDLSSAIEGLVFARLAAAHGGQEDLGRLFQLMALTGDLLADSEDWAEFRENLSGEAIALVNQLAESGHEWADELLPALVAGSSAEANARAKDIRAMIEAG